MLTVPVVIAVLSKIVPVARPTQKPSTVLKGHGTNCGMPNLYACTTFKSELPLITQAATRIIAKEQVGRQPYRDTKKAVFKTSFPGAIFRSRRPNMTPHTNPSATVRTCVHIPAVKATHSTKYMPTSTAK